MQLKNIGYKRRPYALYAFLWALLLAAIIVAPIMIKDRGYFLYYGDFNVQEIPFYRLAHDSILAGDTGWSHLTDLGANFVGSYSFYLLGSPFFWLTMALPSAAVPYAMGPLVVLKLAFCSLTAYIYIRRYVRNPYHAVMGGILYAFSGFSVYNIFFFHFHEPMIVFPLLLAALDEFHAAKRRGLVALTICLSATVNYYFFFGQALFLLIYYIVKLVSRSYRFNIKDFLCLAAEAVIGVLMSMVLMLPSLAAITGNYRVSEILNGWNTLIYSNSQRYIQILVSFFFPGDVPARNNFTPSAGAKWSSVAVYLPMFSMSFVIAYMRTRKKSFFTRLIVILLIMAFVPFFNSAFQALNDDYYARWFYMLTLMLVAVTCKAIEDMDEIDYKKGFIPAMIITLILTLAIGLIPEKTEDGAKREIIRVGLSAHQKHFWAFCIIAVGGLYAACFLYIIYKKKPQHFMRVTALCLSLFVVLYTEAYLWSGKRLADRDDEFMINYALNYGEDVPMEDLREVRSDFYETSDNLGMFWETPTIQAFHSIVPSSLMAFYNCSGVKRDVGSRPPTEFYGFRGLFSVKYLFVEEDDDNPRDTDDLLPGFEYKTTANGFKIYENQHYIPMGFTFDTYICDEEYKDIATRLKHQALLKALVMSQDQMKKYADITGYTDGMYLNLNFTHNDHDLQEKVYPEYEGYDSITADFKYTEEEYIENADKLAENSCSKFSYTNDGFEAVFDNKGGDNLLFFSVPYDEGWTAYVNDEPADIEKVDIGFMAVRVDGHKTNNIRFVYKTPMLKQGLLITCIGAAAFLIYLMITGGFKAKRKPRKLYRIKQKSTTEEEHT